MKITIAKRNGVEEVHKAGCRDLKNKRGWDSDREDYSFEAETLADVYRDYWQCIDVENVGEGHYPTVEHVWWAWRSEFDVKPCAASLPEMDEPGTESPKASKSEAKNDLARRLVLAAQAMVANLDESDAALSGLSREEAGQFVANWLHSLPTGGRDGERWWETELPRPATADWKR
jgi:hypothetical protein